MARWAYLAIVLTVGACADQKAALPVSPSAPPADPAGSAPILEVLGDPESPTGATWIYRSAEAGLTYDLQGILLKPRGPGPFPAVILSHGKGGSAAGYSRGIATDMIAWGVVCIGTNYTHAAGVALGAPGSAADEGASEANVLRARKLVDILARLGYVDSSRLAAHGHSMGAYVTAAFAGAYPGLLRVASHTAGGVAPESSVGSAAPADAQVRGIRTPYQIHHGDADTVVPLSFDQRLAAILAGGGIENELFVYPGAAHNDIARSHEVLNRVRTWYVAHGLF